MEMARQVTRTLREHSYYPRIEEITAYPRGVEVVIEGHTSVNFSSNDYLDFAHEPRIVEAAATALRRFGLGAGGSRLTAGTQEPHVRLEARIAVFKGKEDAVVFSAGYLANVGIIAALAGATLKGVISMLNGGESSDTSLEVFSDQLVHASIIDGIGLTGSKTSRAQFRVSRYEHRNMDRLEFALRRSTAARKLIVTDGVFSLHGRLAPLREIVALARKYEAEVYVDDAHATGVFGENGRGTPELYGVEDGVDFLVGTLSKALGGAGGFIAGDNDFCDYIRVAARTHMFQTSLPPAVAAGLVVAFDIIRDEPERRRTLLRNAARVREELGALGFNIFGGDTQIIPVGFGSAQNAKAATHMLLEEGIFAPCYYYPAVGPDEAMVRVNLTSGHTEEHLDRLLTALARAGRALSVIPEGEPTSTGDVQVVEALAR